MKKQVLKLQVITCGAVEAGQSVFYVETLTKPVDADKLWLESVYGKALDPESAFENFKVNLKRKKPAGFSHVLELVQAPLPKEMFTARNACPPAHVLTVAEQKDQEHREQVLMMGTEILQQTAKVAEKYVNLALYIRKEQLPDALVRSELLKLGFKKTRVSELLRVVKAPEAVWDAYAARQIGLKGALELTRGENPPELIQALALEQGKTPGQVEEELAEHGGEEPEAGASEKTDDEKRLDAIASKLGRLSSLGKLTVALAPALQKLGVADSQICQVWDLGGGYKLELKTSKVKTIPKQPAKK